MVPSPSRPIGPGELVDALTRWAREVSWVDWVELAGSLGRGAGDEYSDVDAGVGVTGGDRVDAVEAAVRTYASTAAVLRQPFGSDSTHLITVYRDGRQLSLVVMPATRRSGLPPQSVALVDKTDRLGAELDPHEWEPDTAQRHEWTFLACISAYDALRHAGRGRAWRALRSLEEARERYFQLLAAREGVVFPQFGVVSLENAGRRLPSELAASLAGTPTPQAIRAAVHTLTALLEPFVTEHGLHELVLALERNIARS